MGGTAEMLILFAMLLYTGYNNFFVNRYLEGELFCKQYGGHKKIAQIFKHTHTPRCNAVREKVRLSIKKLKNESKGVGIDSIKKIKKKAKEELERDEKRVIMKAIDRNILKNEDGVKLYQRLNRLEVLERILFEEHDKVLMPVALLNIIREKERKIENSKITAKKTETRKGVRQLNHEEKDSCGNSEQGIMSIEEAYESLENSNPASGVKKLIKNFILKNLPSGVKKLSEMRKAGRGAKNEPGNPEEQVGQRRESDFSLPEPPSPAPMITDPEEPGGLNLFDGEKSTSSEVKIQPLIAFDDQKEQIRLNDFRLGQRSQKRQSSTIIRNKRSKMMRKAPPARDRLSQATSSQRIVPIKNELEGRLSSLKMLRLDGLSQISEEG